MRGDRLNLSIRAKLWVAMGIESPRSTRHFPTRASSRVA